MPLFGRNTGNTLATILGTIGDALMVREGQQPLYTTLRESRRKDEREEQNYERRRQDDWSDWQRRQEYENAHRPEPNDVFIDRMRRAGIDPNSQQGQALLRQKVITEASPPQNFIGDGQGGGKWVQPPPPQFPGLTGGQPSQGIAPPPEAIEDLRKNPALKGEFDQFYGAGASERYMGGGAGNGAGNFPSGSPLWR